MSYYNKFQKLKKDSLRVAKLINELAEEQSDKESYNRLYNKSVAVAECGNHALFAVTATNEKKLLYNSFCRQRFCPHCAAISSSERSSCLGRVVTKLYNGTDAGLFLFLTLTVRSVPSSDLRDKVQFMLKQFSSFIKDPRLCTGIRGYARNLEVTYNNRTDLYHPHIHVLIHMDSDYFSNPAKYVSQLVWLQVWRRYIHDDSIEFVNVKKVRDPQKAVPEVCKYMTKFNWIYNRNAKKVLLVFMDALKGCNLFRLSGDLRTMFKEVREENKAERKKFKDSLVDDIIQNANSVSDHIYYLSFHYTYDPLRSDLIFTESKIGGYYIESIDYDILSAIKRHPYFRSKFQYVLYRINEYELSKVYERAAAPPDPDDDDDFVNEFLDDV